MTVPAPGDELIDVLDEHGGVVGTATRREMRSTRLRHRATYVFVVRGPELSSLDSAADLDLQPSDRIIVHRRADWKDVYPGYWDIAFGGVCGQGEEWRDSARRELREEAGIDANLVLLGEGEYEDDKNHSFGRVYLARSQADVVCADGEVVAVDEVPIGELADWATGRSVCPDSLQLAAETLLAISG